jgi:hypothetical protein
MPPEGERRAPARASSRSSSSLAENDRGRLILVRDRDPFPVPGRVGHQRLQGWNDRGERDGLSHVATVPHTADTQLLMQCRVRILLIRTSPRPRGETQAHESDVAASLASALCR